MIHYISAIYTGRRKNTRLSNMLSDKPHFLAKMQINALRFIDIPLVKKVTFVISPSHEERDNHVVKYIQDRIDVMPGVEINAYIAPNNDYWSYSAWNDCMGKNINDDNHFFLIEDDYAPSKSEFYAPFMKKISDKIAYVSQFSTTVDGGRYRASISNGLMNIDAAKKHHEKFGRCLHLPRPRGKIMNRGVEGQKLFLDNFQGLGYSVKDISDEYHQPFLTSRNEIISFGKRHAESVIEPYTFFKGDQ